MVPRPCSSMAWCMECLLKSTPTLTPSATDLHLEPFLCRGAQVPSKRNCFFTSDECKRTGRVQVKSPAADSSGYLWHRGRCQSASQSSSQRQLQKMVDPALFESDTSIAVGHDHLATHTLRFQCSSKRRVFLMRLRESATFPKPRNNIDPTSEDLMSFVLSHISDDHLQGLKGLGTSSLALGSRCKGTSSSGTIGPSRLTLSVSAHLFAHAYSDGGRTPIVFGDTQ